MSSLRKWLLWLNTRSGFLSYVFSQWQLHYVMGKIKKSCRIYHKFFRQGAPLLWFSQLDILYIIIAKNSLLKCVSALRRFHFLFWHHHFCSSFLLLYHSPSIQTPALSFCHSLYRHFLLFYHKKDDSEVLMIGSDLISRIAIRLRAATVCFMKFKPHSYIVQLYVQVMTVHHKSTKSATSLLMRAIRRH